MNADTCHGKDHGSRCRLMLSPDRTGKEVCAPCQIALYVRDEATGYRKAVSAEVLGVAQTILRDRLETVAPLSAPALVREFLRVRLGNLEHDLP